MDLALTDDQRMIRDEALRLFAADFHPGRTRQAVESGAGFDAALWSNVARDLGWCALAVPQAHGGLGLGMTELVLLLEAAGRRLCAIPLWSTACAAVTLLSAVASEAAKARLLPRIAAGEVAVAVAWGDPGACDPFRTVPVAAARVADGYALTGRFGQVIDLPSADLVLVPARLEGGLALFALEAGTGLPAQRLDTLDATRPMGVLTLQGLAMPASARLDPDGFRAEDAEPAVASASLGLAAEEIGAARGVMDLTLAYISERVQFGRTIASFQAVKHRCALLEVALAEARALVYGAAANAGSARGSPEVAAARALAAETLFRAAEEAIQLHGGVGFTWEYDPHFYLKRAQASASLLGAPHAQLTRVADAILDGGVTA